MSLAQTLTPTLKRLGLYTLAYQLKERSLVANLGYPRRWLDAPLPPPALMLHAAGTMDKAWFEWSGRLTATRIFDLLSTQGVNLEGVRDVLDFGCGCGRVTRYLSARLPQATLSGTDTDARSIAWCGEHLRGAYVTGGGLPPLGYADASMDLVVAYSVFTHIHANYQREWLRELVRVLRPGGWLVFSTMDYLADCLSATEGNKGRFHAGEIVTPDAAHGGYVAESDYGTFHPQTAIAPLCASAGLTWRVTLPAQPAPPMVGAGHALHGAQRG